MRHVGLPSPPGSLRGARARPDLIQTDVMMRRMEGIQLLQQLRNDARTRHIPVVLISTRAGEEARTRAGNRS
jgi:CheY-like chemotaxis protein